MSQTKRATIKFLTVLTVFPLAYGLFAGAGAAAATTTGSTQLTGVAGAPGAPERHCC